jgi:hypothetical protein
MIRPLGPAQMSLSNTLCYGTHFGMNFVPQAWFQQFYYPQLPLKKTASHRVKRLHFFCNGRPYYLEKNVDLFEQHVFAK